ncbi:MAG TPA: glycosyltransferase [Rhodocyclaceae bacterium]|nr:glycosyltransferase [Rhodocyclaceae bacterium]
MNTHKLAIVVLTHNRRQEILATLERLAGSGAFPICVVDNGSGDGTASAVARAFPAVRILRLEANLGAAGRNHGVRQMDAAYIAFCDDDTWWEPDSLARAADILDRYPRLAAVTARVLVGPENREDPTSALMAASPLPNLLGIPGAELAGFMAGACVMRRSAFLAAGGYEPRFFIGGEERLLALDLLAAGWHLGYIPDLVVHHHPSRLRDASGRRRLLLRNALWCAWLRRPLGGAWQETRRWLAGVRDDPEVLAGALAALSGLPWVLQNRRPLPAHVELRLRLLERDA